MRNLIWLCALVMLATAACKTSAGGTRSLPGGKDCANLALRLDRSHWMVNKQTRTSNILARRAPNRPPELVGYLVMRQYREMRGGPEFKVYSVTTLNRDEQIGHIDQLGRAYRYEPRRNGSFDTISVGANSLESNIGAIFDTTDSITVTATNERRLAFDALDANGDGLLQLAETRSFGDRVTGADANGDGVVDFAEFDAVDVL